MKAKKKLKTLKEIRLEKHRRYYPPFQMNWYREGNVVRETFIGEGYRRQTRFDANELLTDGIEDDIPQGFTKVIMNCANWPVSRLPDFLKKR